MHLIVAEKASARNSSLSRLMPAIIGKHGHGKHGAQINNATQTGSSKAQEKAVVPAKSIGKPCVAWNPAEIAEAFRRFRAANPEPKGELIHINSYTLLWRGALRPGRPMLASTKRRLRCSRPPTRRRKMAVN